MSLKLEYFTFIKIKKKTNFSRFLLHKTCNIQYGFLYFPISECFIIILCIDLKIFISILKIYIRLYL